jgi:hypothetical protein
VKYDFKKEIKNEEFLISGIIINDLSLLCFSKGTMIVLKEQKIKHKFERDYIVNKCVLYDENHILLVGNDSHISFFNMDTLFFNGSMKIEF